MGFSTQSLHFGADMHRPQRFRASSTRMVVRVWKGSLHAGTESSSEILRSAREALGEYNAENEICVLYYLANALEASSPSAPFPIPLSYVQIEQDRTPDGADLHNYAPSNTIQDTRKAPTAPLPPGSSGFRDPL
jgi:hypothetical protein